MMSKEDFAPGGLVDIGDCAISPGGPVSNVGIALSKLGMKKIYALATVGNDVFGDILKKETSAFLLGQKIKTLNFPTSYTIALTPPGKDRTYLHCPGVSDTFSSKNVDLDGLPPLSWFHFGYPPLMNRIVKSDGKELRKIFSSVKKRSAQTITSLDMSMPGKNNSTNWRKFFINVLPFVDVFCPSLEEIVLMCRSAFYSKLRPKNTIDQVPISVVQDISKELLSFGCKAVIVKIGHRGLYANVSSPLLNWTPKEGYSPACRVKVVNAIGAGDACIAGLIFSALRGDDLDRSLSFANKVASYSVRSTNTFDLIPNARFV